MKDVQCYELFGGIALKNHAFSYILYHISRKGQLKNILFHNNFSKLVRDEYSYVSSIY